MRVFYEDWQMECRGTPFAVGDEVAWKLVAHDERDRPGDAGYGAPAWAENHGGPDRPATGRVRERGAVLRGTGRGLEPVPGTVTLEPAARCPKRFAQTGRGTVAGQGRVRRTMGALVTLERPRRRVRLPS
jgi:hypothetical protein